MGEIGELFGTLIIIFYGLTILNFCFKFINKKYKKEIKKHKKFSEIFTFFLRFFMKYHKVFGFMAVLAILLHFYFQYTRFGLNIAGVIAAGVMIFQVIFGAYGQYTKRKGKLWLSLHRAIALFVFATILLHVL